MSDKLQIAISKILRPTKDEYYHAHAGWWDTDPDPEKWQPLVFKYPNLILVGSAHSYTPNSPMITQIKQVVNQFLSDTTNSSPKLVMVEGYSNGKIPNWSSLTEAINISGESGMTAHLAQTSDVEVISPEVEANVDQMRQLARQLLSQFTPEQIVLYYVIESLGSIKRKNMVNQEYLAGVIYRFSALYNPSFLPEASPQSIKNLTSIKAREAMVQRIWSEAVPQLNKLCQLMLNRPLLVVSGNQIQIGLSDEMVTRSTDPTIFPDKDHPYASTLNDISRVEDAARDDYLVTTIYSKYQQGKNILTVYGGSHILAIKPAIDYLASKDLL